ncbi:trehalose-phosphatase [Henriciella marina]|uniref:trehalose-phosphatase n=1 Tax=Henriciella marina TaxID=453851 RepID=UPI00036119F7|nr:trehalose-phosphatase [Henriciella marina]
MTATANLPQLTDRHVLFLDFDGTLAPIQDDAATVRLPDGVGGALADVHGFLAGAVIIISGRDIRDLSSRVPDIFWRAGTHGLEICAPGTAPEATRRDAPVELTAAVNAALDGLDGVHAEAKGEVIAFHYRQNPDIGPLLGARLEESLAGIEGYKLQAGKMIFEAKPDRANKGKAVETLLKLAGLEDRIPVMVGDDTTDEDAFDVVNRLGGVSIKVGSGETHATYRLDDPEAVAEWIKRQGRK